VFLIWKLSSEIYRFFFSLHSPRDTLDFTMEADLLAPLKRYWDIARFVRCKSALCAVCWRGATLAW